MGWPIIRSIRETQAFALSLFPSRGTLSRALGVPDGFGYNEEIVVPGLTVPAERVEVEDLVVDASLARGALVDSVEGVTFFDAFRFATSSNSSCSWVGARSSGRRYLHVHERRGTNADEDPPRPRPNRHTPAPGFGAAFPDSR